MSAARKRLAAILTLAALPFTTAAYVGLASPASPAQAAPAVAAVTPVGLGNAHWIWYPEGDARTSVPAAFRYFRKSFTVPGGTVSDAQLVVTGDDTVDVWLNGTPLAGSARPADSWRQALYVDLSSALTSGTNTLAVAVHNTSVGPAGLLGAVHVASSGGTVDLTTDSSWKSAQTAPTGWETSGFADSGWPAATDLGVYGTGPWAANVVPPDTTAASPLSATALTTEHRANPLGVDAAAPRFGWQLTAGQNTQRQGAYEISVSSTNAATGDVWDSGRVASQQSVDVTYHGPALASLTRYFWRVRVWDSQGRASAWSAVAFFETALLAPGTEWQGDFIGQTPSGVDLSGSSWIWYPEGDPVAGVPAETRYFRRDFTLTAAPGTSTLVVTGDDTADVWVNGTEVANSARVFQSWQQATVVDVTAQLRAGANTIAVASENTTQSPAGMIAKLVVTGGPIVSTDASWKAAQTVPGGWQQTTFDDSGWVAARSLLAYGTGPWASNVVVPRPSPLLRKGFTVAKPVASARLLATALGLEETHLNGAKVGADILAPGWTDYTKRLQYKEYDVTAQIQQGANSIGAELGNGWYDGSIGFAGSQRYGTQPFYSAELRIVFTDGTSTIVKTDSTWKAAAGPIRSDDLYAGETYDARAAIAGWDAAGYNDTAWAGAQVRSGTRPTLEAEVDNGVTVQQQLRPVAVTQPTPGVFVLDMGQNFAGVNRLKVTGPAGTKVTMRHAEVLNPNGTIYTDNLRTARATDTFTLAGTGTQEVYTPTFTIHGYRYVELTGFPGTPTADSVTGLMAWQSGAQSGTFSTSNALVNQLQHNIVYGERSNMLSIPTDCPQRDERLGWTGDIGIFAATSTFNLDDHDFLDKFADDLTDAQQSNGAFTDVAPYVAGGSGTAGWGDAGVIIPYTLWQRYGDLGVVDQHFDAMARWVDYLKSTAGSDLIRNVSTYGDWLNVNDNTAQDVVSTAYFAWSARLVSRMAAATGRTAQATTYGTLADQVSAAFTAHYVSADGTVSGNTQTGYVMALAFGLLPANLVQPAADKLAAKVASTNGHLSVGFLGVENLLPVLAEHNHLATAYQILTQPDFPGWGYQINHGATTIWERWDGIKTDGTFNDPGMNSFNHYGLGSVGDFLYRDVAGLSPAGPGYRSLAITPHPGGGLTTATASLATAYGPATSSWTTTAGQLTLHVTIPAGTAATVTVPTSAPTAVASPPEAVPTGTTPATYYLPSGTYTFTAPV